MARREVTTNLFKTKLQHNNDLKLFYTTDKAIFYLQLVFTEPRRNLSVKFEPILFDAVFPASF